MKQPKQTLLEMAKSHQVRKTHKKVFNDEELELILCFYCKLFQKSCSY